MRQGKGGQTVVCAYGGGGDGRGNLRIAKMDCAPTVGRLRGCHCVSHYDPNAAIAAASLRVPRPRQKSM